MIDMTRMGTDVIDRGEYRVRQYGGVSIGYGGGGVHIQPIDDSADDSARVIKCPKCGTPLGVETDDKFILLLGDRPVTRQTAIRCSCGKKYHRRKR